MNAIAVNSDGVCVSGADNGSMQWFDWRTGYNFQRDQGLFQKLISVQCHLQTSR